MHSVERTQRRRAARWCELSRDHIKVAPPSTQGAAFHPSLLRPGEGERSPVPRIASRPLLARPAMQGGGRAIFASQRPRRNRRRRATRSRRPDCPRRECVPPRRGTQGQCRRDAARETTPAKARLASVAWGSPSKSQAWLHRNFLAHTRAPPGLRWARCGRTSTFVIVPRRAA